MSVWSSIGRRNQIVCVAVVVCLALAAASGGCYAHRRPAAMNAEERKLLEAAPLPYTVSVVPWNSEPGEQAGRDPDAYAKSLAKLVAGSKAFRASRLEARPGADADLVAISNGAHCNTAIIPVFTIITVGLIPTVFEDEDCHGVVIRSARPSTSQPVPEPVPQPVEIGVRHKGQVVMGWAALVFGALPGWSYGSGSDDSRYRERFRLEVITHREEIEKLAAH
jgi:hypothetical protein